MCAQFLLFLSPFPCAQRSARLRTPRRNSLSGPHHHPFPTFNYGHAFNVNTSKRSLGADGSGWSAWCGPSFPSGKAV